MSYIYDSTIILNPPTCHDTSLTLTEERHNRVYACILIHSIGQNLQLDSIVLATACNILHRTYHNVSMTQYNIFTVILTSLFIAMKTCEIHRSMNQLICTGTRILQRIQQTKHIQNSGDSVNNDVIDLTQDIPVIEKQSIQYSELQHNILCTELVILTECSYTVYVELPHQYIFHFVSLLTPNMDINLPDNIQYKQLLQLTYNYINDSMYTVVSTQYQPYEVTVACIYMAIKSLNIVVPDEWYDIFDTTMYTIKQICSIMKTVLYKTNEPFQYIPVNKLDEDTNILINYDR